MLMVEPVQRLCHGYQIDTVIGKATAFGRSWLIADVFPRGGLCQLLRRKVSGMDVDEMVCQAQRGLPVACAAIPGQPVPRALAGKPGKQLRRIGGAKPRVILRVCGKVIGRMRSQRLSAGNVAQS